jgi:eukaryotic-like serine/threonine-protein kinase
MCQKRYAAGPLLLAGYEGMKNREANISLHAKPRLNEAVERLARLYEATASKNEAAMRRKEL